MDYKGPSRRARVKILGASESEWRRLYPKAERFWLNDFIGKECEAIIYEQLGQAQISVEQLSTGFPRYGGWQSVDLRFVQEI